MQVNFSTTTNSFVIDNVEPGDVFKVIANRIAQLQAPDTVTINTPIGNARFQLIPGGGAFFVREEYNDISIPDNETLGTVYLVMVNPEHNNYKFYKLEDCGGGQVLATYGRIGASSSEVFGERTHYYPKHMYYIKLAEKLAKGYKDMSDVYLVEDAKDASEPSEKTTNSVDGNSPAVKLYNTLKAYSRHVIRESCISSNVTKSMVEKTRELLSELYAITDDVDKFNTQLLKILEVSPRRVYKVSDLLAKGVSDFENIVNREDSLLMAMEAVAGSASDKSHKAKIDGFDMLGVKVHYATEKQREEVLKHLNDTLRPKVRNIYRVIAKRQKERFNKYLEDNHIRKVKQLWHGSRNENWLSIVSNGLMLRPNAVITGKMFGDGIYFAPSPSKSWGYTSSYGSYWARGTSDTAFMGLYACAIGTPLDVTCAHRYDQTYLKSIGKNCVHAHAGTQLRNDEIVFYDEAAILLNYIVEFDA